MMHSRLISYYDNESFLIFINQKVSLKGYVGGLP